MAENHAALSIRHVQKHFGAYAAVDRVAFDVQDNEFFALLGPSGCGKTTLLRMIAGFEQPDGGDLLIGGESMLGVPPNRRPANMVFQSYAVFPHMSVRQNVGYGLQVTGTPRRELDERVAEALSMVKLDGYERHKAHQLSGGQRQRVALARALAKRPEVLLLDEPMSALDAKLREAMQRELVRLQHTTGITFIHVTHDQNEALSMADRVAVMNQGRVEQLAAPRELYERPANRFVADFIGTINLLSGTTADGGAQVAVDGLGELPVRAPDGSRDVTLAIRPEKIRLAAERPADTPFAFQGRIAEVAYFGDYSRLFVTAPTGQPITVHVLNSDDPTTGPRRVGETVWCTWSRDDTLILNE
jgi:spermidine/putrescine transport system ATP-binding protein/putrescine transport system ATP-binding protein